MKCTCAAPFASALNYGVFRARLICLHSLSVALNRRLLVEGVQTNQRCRNKTKSQRSGRAQFHTSFEKQIEWIFPDTLLDQGMLDLVKCSFPPPTLIYNLTHSWICPKPLIMLTRMKRGSKRTREKERHHQIYGILPVNSGHKNFLHLSVRISAPYITWTFYEFIYPASALRAPAFPLLFSASLRKRQCDGHINPESF